MSNGTEFSATVFEITIDDIIGYDPSTFVNTQVVGETKSRGAEVSLAFYPMDTLDVRLSAAYTDSKKPEASGSGDMVRELRVPRVQAGLNVSWRPRADLSIGASVRYVHDTVDFGSVELDDYTLLGVTGQWQFQEETSLFGRIENVADEDYQVVNGYGTSGRAVYVGVRRSF